MEGLVGRSNLVMDSGFWDALVRRGRLLCEKILLMPLILASDLSPFGVTWQVKPLTIQWRLMALMSPLFRSFSRSFSAEL